MKKIIALFTLIFSLQAQAALLTVKLDRDQFVASENVIADIWISELTEPLSAFEMALWFDSSVFKFNDLVFGNKLNATDPTDPLLPRGFSVSGNVLELDEASFDWPEELQKRQGPAFILASINFTALKGGVFDLKLENVLLTDVDGFEFDASLTKVVDAQGTVVPAPATALLLLPALLFLARRRQLAAN